MAVVEIATVHQKNTSSLLQCVYQTDRASGGRRNSVGSGDYFFLEKLRFLQNAWFGKSLIENLPQSSENTRSLPELFPYHE